MKKTLTIDYYINPRDYMIKNGLSLSEFGALVGIKDKGNVHRAIACNGLAIRGSKYYLVPNKLSGVFK